MLGLTLLFTAAAAQPSIGHFPGLPALLPVLGAALIILHPSQGLTQQLLVNKPMTWIGELSYSLYLWHWPVLAFLRYYTGAEVLTAPFSLLFIVLTLLLATLSFYGIEAPLRAKNTRVKQALAYATLACLALGTSKGMATVNQVLSPDPLPIEYRRYADPASICHGHIVGECLKGDLNSEKEVLVLGDSHAAMLNHFFDYLGKELGFKARIITGSSCVTIPGFDYQRIPEWARESCLLQIEQAQLYLEQAGIIFLAASWNWHLDNYEFKRAITNFLQGSAPQADKYIISQEPLLNRNPMRNYRFTYLGIGVEAERNNDYLRTNQVLATIAQASNNATYLALDGLELFSSSPMWKEQLIYYDEHHLNEVGVFEYARQAKLVVHKRLSSDEKYTSPE